MNISVRRWQSGAATKEVIVQTLRVGLYRSSTPSVRNTTSVASVFEDSNRIWYAMREPYSCTRSTTMQTSEGEREQNQSRVTTKDRQHAESALALSVSKATRLHSDMAAILRGWVHPIFRMPPPSRYWHTCVDFCSVKSTTTRTSEVEPSGMPASITSNDGRVSKCVRRSQCRRQPG
jgi:hypothetical protein